MSVPCVSLCQCPSSNVLLFQLLWFSINTHRSGSFYLKPHLSWDVLFVKEGNLKYIPPNDFLTKYLLRIALGTIKPPGSRQSAYHKTSVVLVPRFSLSHFQLHTHRVRHLLAENWGFQAARLICVSWLFWVSVSHPLSSS